MNSPDSGIDPDRTALLKALGDTDLRELGMGHIAYIRPVRLGNQDVVFSVHAADGTPLSLVDSFENALAVTAQNDLRAITVH